MDCFEISKDLLALFDIAVADQIKFKRNKVSVERGLTVPINEMADASSSSSESDTTLLSNSLPLKLSSQTYEPHFNAWNPFLKRQRSFHVQESAAAH